MSQGIAKVALVGQMGDRGVDVAFSGQGTACATFVVIVEELAKDGKAYRTFVPCEIWGKGAEAAAEIAPGTQVFLDGKLRWRSDGEKTGKIVVSGFELKIMHGNEGSYE